MAIIFDHEIIHGSYEHPIISAEPNNDLWLYFIKGLRLNNFLTAPYRGFYDNIIFKSKPQVITAKQIRHFGIKHLPGFGAYAFFTLRYRDTSYVLCPIHKQHVFGLTPNVTITPLAEGFQFDITSTEKYECYRIELVKDYLTEEYIVYGEDGTATKIIDPELSGELEVYVTGYIDEISIASTPWEGFIESAGHAPFPSPTGATNFLELTDTPDSYEEMQGKIVNVKINEMGLQFIEKQQTHVITLLTTEWPNNQQTIYLSGVTVDNTILIAPTPASQSGYVANGIMCINQFEDTLVFSCTSIPNTNIDVNVVLL